MDLEGSGVHRAGNWELWERKEWDMGTSGEGGGLWGNRAGVRGAPRAEKAATSRSHKPCVELEMQVQDWVLACPSYRACLDTLLCRLQSSADILSLQGTAGLPKPSCQAASSPVSSAGAGARGDAQAWEQLQQVWVRVGCATALTAPCCGAGTCAPSSVLHSRPRPERVLSMLHPAKSNHCSKQERNR